MFHTMPFSTRCVFRTKSEMLAGWPYDGRQCTSTKNKALQGICRFVGKLVRCQDALQGKKKQWGLRVSAHKRPFFSGISIFRLDRSDPRAWIVFKPPATRGGSAQLSRER